MGRGRPVMGRVRPIIGRVRPIMGQVRPIIGGGFFRQLWGKAAERTRLFVGLYL